MQPIILYDTPSSKVPKNIWAPNPAKTRFCLSYKGLPHEIVLVEFKDITCTLEAIGASPTAGDRYTVPVIKDPNTGAIVSDSLAIAEYLDKTYPEKPVIPCSTNVLMAAFEPMYCDIAYGKAVKYILTRTLAIQNDSSREYFINTRLAMFGASSWEEMEESPEQQWEDFSFADMVVACRTMWWNAILDEEKRQELHCLNDRRWVKVLADVNAECGTDL